MIKIIKLNNLNFLVKKIIVIKCFIDSISFHLKLKLVTIAYVKKSLKHTFRNSNFLM